VVKFLDHVSFLRLGSFLSQFAGQTFSRETNRTWGAVHQPFHHTQNIPPADYYKGIICSPKPKESNRRKWCAHTSNAVLETALAGRKRVSCVSWLFESTANETTGER